MSRQKSEYSIYWQSEFTDFLQVLEFGAKKHGELNWLEPGGKKSSFNDMHASMFRHLAESQSQQTLGHTSSCCCGNVSFLGRGDKESGLDPLLHLAARALMMYTRLKRELYHPED